MRILASLFVLFSISATAQAQDHQPGVYDGRNIAGWTYSERGTAAAGLPSWYPSDGSAERDGANCNVGSSVINGSAAEWAQFFSSTTPSSFAQQLNASGTSGARGYLTDVLSRDGRLVMRNLLAANAAGQDLEFMIVSVSGSDRLVTITCTAMAGRLLPRLEMFDCFARQLVIETAPAQ